MRLYLSIRWNHKYHQDKVGDLCLYPIIVYKGMNYYVCNLDTDVQSKSDLEMRIHIL